VQFVLSTRIEYDTFYSCTPHNAKYITTYDSMYDNLLVYPYFSVLGVVKMLLLGQFVWCSHLHGDGQSV